MNKFLNKIQNSLPLMVVMFFGFVIGLIINFLTSCNSAKPLIGFNDNELIESYTYNINRFDSICDSDNLSKKLSNWHRIDLQNFEDKKYQTKYMFILSDSIIYIIEDNIIIKRKMIHK